MFQKLFVLAFITSAVCAGVAAQTPEPLVKVEPHSFTWSFDGDGGYLGVQTEEVTKANLSKYGLREVRGVAVAKVLDGSPAQAAGIQEGDVIVKVNGEAITSSRKLTRLINEISPDHTAKLTVLRSGSEREINVTVGKRPMPKFAEGAFAFPEAFEKFQSPAFEKFEMPAMPELDKLPKVEMWQKMPGTPGVPFEHNMFTFGSRRQIGVGLTPLTKQLSEHFGVTNGALVNNVREDSPAAKAGLKAGDIIVEVDGKAVKGDWDIANAIREKKDGDVSLTFVRGGNKQTVRVTPEEMKGEPFFEFHEGPGFTVAPGTPSAPGVKVKPGTPPSPAPMNQLFVPGRIV